MIFAYLWERIRTAFAEEPKPYWRPQPHYGNWCVSQAEKGRRHINYIWEKR